MANSPSVDGELSVVPPATARVALPISGSFTSGAFGDASPGTLAVVKAFGGGAILTMLADTMMPEAFEHVGPATGLATMIGFILAIVIATLEHQA